MNLPLTFFAMERDYQKQLKRKIKMMFQGCYLMKTDCSQYQGIPDLLILYKSKWAMLEVKDSAKSKKRPNQDLRVERINNMSFARIIYPENEEEVLNDLQRYFEAE